MTLKNATIFLIFPHVSFEGQRTEVKDADIQVMMRWDDVAKNKPLQSQIVMRGDYDCIISVGGTNYIHNIASQTVLQPYSIFSIQ